MRVIQNREIGKRERFAAGFNDEKIPVRQTKIFRQHALDSKPLAADEAAAFEDVAADAGGHAGPKPMFANSFQLFGLPGVLHCHMQNYITKMYLKNCGFPVENWIYLHLTASL